MAYNIRWSDEAIRNLEGILADIESKWTKRELEIFKKKLSHQLELLSKNPLIFPKSDFNPKLRKSVLSRQTTLFYKIDDKIIYLAYIHLNRRDIGRIV